jgi:hypothetical protein
LGCVSALQSGQVHVIDAVSALRHAFSESRQVLSPTLRIAALQTAGIDSVDGMFDNGTSLWPVTLTRPLSETKFGNIPGRRSPSYGASWTYVPVVFTSSNAKKDNGLYNALGCMDYATLERGMKWFSTGEAYNAADPACCIAFLPIFPERDIISRLAITTGSIQCQDTWTQMGSLAHERLRSYDILIQAENSKVVNTSYAPDFMAKLEANVSIASAKLGKSLVGNTTTRKALSEISQARDDLAIALEILRTNEHAVEGSNPIAEKLRSSNASQIDISWDTLRNNEFTNADDRDENDVDVATDSFVGLR